LIFGEMLHCVLEIGMYPVLARQAPHEMIGLINAMYEQTLYGRLEGVGGIMLLVGILVFSVATWRAAVLPAWSALLLASTDLAAILAFTPATRWIVGSRFPVMFYLSMIAIGYARRTVRAHLRTADCILA
jgi:hypothetical protein